MSRIHETRRGERGAALVLAILVLAILTVIGIALMLITSTESRIAANEWSINRAYYSADSGIRWATVQLTDPAPFLTRTEFGAPLLPNFLGTVFFQLPSHRGFFSGVPAGNDVQVTVTTPGRLGRRPFRGGIINEQGARAQYMYAFELRSTGGQADAFLQYSKALVADVEAGPLPARLPF
jgi:hypothetical protein